MKNLKIELLTLLIVLSTAAFASTGEKKSTRSSRIEVVKTEDVFKLYYLADSKRNVFVKILDKSGKVVYSEKHARIKGFARPYNFASLPKGEYQFIINDGAGQMEYPIEFKDLKVKSAPVIRFDELMNTEKGLYRLTIAEEGSHIAKVRIYDENSQLLYEGKDAFENGFAKLYNLQKVKGPGFLTIEVDNRIKKFEF